MKSLHCRPNPGFKIDPRPKRFVPRSRPCSFFTRRLNGPDLRMADFTAEHGSACHKGEGDDCKNRDTEEIQLSRTFTSAKLPKFDPGAKSGKLHEHECQQGRVFV